MNFRPLYWTGLIAVLVFVGAYLNNHATIPKNQPFFKQVPAQRIAFIHYEGPYEDMPLLFKALVKEGKFRISGPGGTLYYPTQPHQKPTYEAYFPIKKDWVPEESAIQFKDLPSANMLVFYHKGPYANLELTHEKTMRFFSGNKIAIKSKWREVYVKGPGWIFKGNPKKYITELQFEL